MAARITTAQRLTALETQLSALVSALEAAQARTPAQSAPRKAAAASPAIERASVCACGAEYKRGRDVREIAASPVGLCGLKGYASHKVAR